MRRSSGAFGFPAAAPKLFAFFDIAGVLGGGFVDDLGVPGRELQFVLSGKACLELSAAFYFRVQFGTEEQCQVGEPEPEQEDDDPGEGSVGFVVVGELRDIETEQGGCDDPSDDGD